MIIQDFILSQLTDLLQAPDIQCMLFVSHSCHDFFKKEINKIIVGCKTPFSRNCFHCLITRNLGETDLRIPILSSSLLEMKKMLLMGTMGLLSAVDRFYIRNYQSHDLYTDTLYLGKYIQANPKMQGVSQVDVCSVWGVWKSAIFIRREDDYFILRYLWHQKDVRIHHLSPRVSPPFYQIQGGGMQGGGPIYQ